MLCCGVESPTQLQWASALPTEPTARDGNVDAPKMIVQTRSAWGEFLSRHQHDLAGRSTNAYEINTAALTIRKDRP